MGLKNVLDKIKEIATRPNGKQMEAVGRYFHMLSVASMSGFAAAIWVSFWKGIILFFLAVVLFITGTILSRGTE